LTAHERAVVLDAIERQLLHQPLAEGCRQEATERRRHRGQGDSTVKTIKMSSARRSLAEYAAGLGDEIVVVTDRNRAVAAIVPLKNVDRESIALSGHPEFLRLIARSRADFAAGRTLSLDEMRHAVLPARSPNRRMQPTPRKARRG
jgi:antitoxin (DNA-binding transcriptional repressor) of toxin-antitoxin stability system